MTRHLALAFAQLAFLAVTAVGLLTGAPMGKVLARGIAAFVLFVPLGYLLGSLVQSTARELAAGTAEAGQEAGKRPGAAAAAAAGPRPADAAAPIE